MKRILIFSLAYYPANVSGAEVAIKEITDRIDPAAFEFSMVTHRFSREAPRSERIGNVTVYRVGVGPSYLSKILFVPLAALKAASLHRTQPFDGAWAMMTYMLFPLVLARALGMRVPYSLALQDGDPYEKVFKRWFIRPVAPLLTWGIRHATVVQAISHYLATWPARRGDPRPIEVIPNGASLESLLEFTNDELNAESRMLGKKEGEIYLLSIGRLVPQKAIDDVIRALALLPARVRLAVVGDGPDKPMLIDLAKKLGVAERVLFTGQVNRTQTAKFRKLCDIFILPSRSEGQGISFLSAMASGLPVIATQEGGLADFLFDAKRNPDKAPTGWAVDKNSPEQIAAAVTEIIANPAQAKQTTENARHMVREKYDWTSIAQDMERKVFMKILKS